MNGFLSFLRRRRVDREMADELRAHIEERVDALMEDGVDESAARRQARRELGNSRAIRERVFEANGYRLLDSLGQDIKVAVRNLLRRPAFTFGTALTLGLGIGATTCIYAVVDGVLLGELPYEDPSRLVTVGPVNSTDPWIDQSANLQNLSLMSFGDFDGLAERARSFAALAAIDVGTSVLSDVGNGPESIVVASVSPDLLELLGARPVAGRAFLEEEHRVGAERVAMISYSVWQNRFGGRPDVFERPIERLGAWTLVGVLPPDFEPPEVYFPDGRIPELWTPLAMNDTLRESDPRGRLHVLGRLAEGATIADARGETGQIAASLSIRTLAENNTGFEMGVNSLETHTAGSARTALTMFLAASGLLLLLAVMNASTLLLVRSLDRGRELGVRMALGAGRIRIVGSILGESAVLAILGGALGIVLAYGGVTAFLRYAPPSIPRLGNVAVDGRVLAAATLVSLLAGILAGLYPAIRQTARGAAEHLANGAHSSSAAGARARGTLLVGQITLAVVLLSGAGLLLGSFVRLQAVDPGFSPDGLITMDVSIGAFARARPDQFASVPAAWDLALQELGGVPGVESVAGATAVPFEVSSWRPGLLAQGISPEAARDGVTGYSVTPGFMDTMGIGVLSGRDFNRLDAPGTESVALVNESFVRTELGGRDPIDAIVVRIENDPQDPLRFVEVPTRIVGVVEDVLQARVEDGNRPAIYVPYTQVPGELRAVVRASIPADTIVPELRRAAARFNPLFPVENVQTMNQRWDRTLTSPRFHSLVIVSFAAVAMLLAALGIYGFVAFSVRRRERELGIRLALGADRWDVARIVLKQGLGLSLAGLALGTMAAPVLTRALRSMLFELEPGDPGILVAVGAVLATVSIAACLIPVQRATAVDPISVLRAE